MYQARSTALREIDTRSHGMDVCRMFAQVTHVQNRGGFICGTAMSGLQSIEFDSYSFGKARDGFYVGPVHVRGYDEKIHGPIVRQGTRQGAHGTILYGRVVQTEPGRFRFHSATVATELHFFWNNLQQGTNFVHAMKERFLIRHGPNPGDFCGDLYAVACLLTGDAHTLMHMCLPEKKRPPRTEDLKLSVTPAELAITLSLFSQSAEPFLQFKTVVERRKKTVKKEHLDALYLDGSSRKQPITAAIIRHVVQSRKDKALSELREVLENDGEEEEAGVLSDDEEEAFDRLVDPSMRYTDE
jgi:hypothetical protein